jgi:hypothetical protein
MSNKNTDNPKHADQLKNLEPKSDQVKGGREPTKHPAKVTVPDIKFG